MLSATALVLALWLVISGTPLEQEPTALKQELSQGAVCLRLADAIARGSAFALQTLLFDAWSKAECTAYFAGVAK